VQVGIVSYGSYVPKNRKKVDEKFRSKLMVEQRSVASSDEDAATIAVAAAQNALSKTNLCEKKIGAVYIGSESHPYAVKPTSTIVADALNLDSDFMTADVEFACKGGTAAIQICYGFLKARMVEYGLAIGSDVAQAEPGDVLEQTAAAGGAAFILGVDEDEIIATIDETISITSNTPDFWRRNLQKYPEHTNRFTGEPSYFKHTICASKKIMEKTGFCPKDFSYVVFHQPNGKFPLIAAKRLGFTKEQVEPSLMVKKIGNCYSASSLLGLCSVLDVAQAGEKILLVSYGSGSGSDAFVLTKRVLTKTGVKK